MNAHANAASVPAVRVVVVLFIIASLVDGSLIAFSPVMPGLVPGIHVFLRERKGVDGRDKPGHDDYSENTKIMVALLPRLRSSGVVATRPIELRVSPVAIAMYCLPLTS